MRLRVIFFLCLIFPLLTGWGHWGPKVKIGLLLDHVQGRETLVNQLKDELEENRAELLMKDAKGDPAVQEEQVRDLISHGVQALVVLSADPSKASPLIQAAHKAGIKVIALETLIPNCDLDYLVAYDAVKAGELQARVLAEKVPKGRYVLLGVNPDGGSLPSLREGQMKILKPLIDRDDIQIASSRESKDENSETPKNWEKEMNAILKMENNGVSAALARDSKAAEGAAMALSKAGLSGKVPVAGIGQDIKTCRRILSGDQTLTIYHSPRKLAEEAAYLAAKLARKATQFDCQFTEMDNGGTKTLAVLLTPMVVDAKNLDSTIIEDKVQKREEVYGK